MLRSSLPVLVVLLLVGIGCDSRSEADTFSVTFTDADGTAIYRGDLDLAIDQPGPADEPGEVTGRWRLEGVGGVPDPVPSAGAVFGSTSLGQIEMSLVVDASDSGFELAGTYDRDRMAGTWAVVTIAGPMPRGTFVATR